MKVLIKGAGDLASGIACRLHHSGMDVVMTEIGVPTTVRRTVAFSPAIYEKRAEVEGIEGVRCDSLEKLILAVAQRKIPVLEDPQCQLAMEWKPDVVVDAIIAKKNLGTSITDAKIVIGVGPGFTAVWTVIVWWRRNVDMIWDGCCGKAVRFPIPESLV